MRSKEEQLEIDDIKQDHIGTQLDIDNWQGALMISGIFLFLIGLMFFIGKCIAYFVEHLF